MALDVLNLRFTSDIQEKIAGRWLDRRVWNSVRTQGWKCVSVRVVCLSEVRTEVNAHGKLRLSPLKGREIRKKQYWDQEDERASEVGGTPRAWGILEANQQCQEEGGIIRGLQRGDGELAKQGGEVQVWPTGSISLNFLIDVWVTKHRADDGDTKNCYFKNSEGTVSSYFLGLSDIYPTIKIGNCSQKRKRRKLKLLKDRFSTSCQIV